MSDHPTGGKPTDDEPDRTTAAGTRPLHRRLQDRLRVVNKHVLNPVLLRLAGRRYVPYGLVRHEGRRSGRTYDTPVLVGTTGDRVVVPLIYGADTDWCRNVRAAGECTVLWQGRAYRATSPRLVEPGEAPGAFPGWAHPLIRAAGAREYLAMDRGPEVPEEYDAVAGDHPAWPVAVGLAAILALVVLAWWVATAGG